MKDKLKIHTSSKSNEWETPKDFFKKYNQFIRGRLKFVNRTFPSWREDGNFKVSPAPFPCSIVIFRPPLDA